jgi:TDG/mug DNA glycosylase family protein
MGNTNLVSRPSKSDAELSKEEQLASVPILEAKIRKYMPEAVCIVGKSIWENIWKYKYGSKPSKTDFKHGWQDERHNLGKLPVESKGEEEEKEDSTWSGARVFVATSSSGLDASTKPAQKEAIWRPFGEWVQQRRKERE